jgi:hypothetical protein
MNKRLAGSATSASVCFFSVRQNEMRPKKVKKDEAHLS